MGILIGRYWSPYPSYSKRWTRGTFDSSLGNDTMGTPSSLHRSLKFTSSNGFLVHVRHPLWPPTDSRSQRVESQPRQLWTPEVSLGLSLYSVCLGTHERQNPQSRVSPKGPRHDTEGPVFRRVWYLRQWLSSCSVIPCVLRNPVSRTLLLKSLK